ncbi:MAG: polysaccharide biosynthesis/export family protein [Xanthobacteraceae bacterium]
MMTKCVVAIVALLASALAACDGPRGIAGDLPARDAMAQSSGYLLSSGDKLRVTVFNEPDLTGEFQIDHSGNVAFPLVGTIAAAGLSTAEFQNRLLRRLRSGYVRNPRVSIEIASYRPFNVFGEVKNSGQYPFRPGLTVQDAIAMAGGFTYRASSRTAYVRRASANGEMTVRLDGPRVSILPGDDVRVPERYF